MTKDISARTTILLRINTNGKNIKNMLKNLATKNPLINQIRLTSNFTCVHTHLTQTKRTS